MGSVAFSKKYSYCQPMAWQKDGGQIPEVLFLPVLCLLLAPSTGQSKRKLEDKRRCLMDAILRSQSLRAEGRVQQVENGSRGINDSHSKQLLTFSTLKEKQKMSSRTNDKSNIYLQQKQRMPRGSAANIQKITKCTQNPHLKSHHSLASLRDQLASADRDPCPIHRYRNTGAYVTVTKQCGGETRFMEKMNIAPFNTGSR